MVPFLSIILVLICFICYGILVTWWVFQLERRNKFLHKQNLVLKEDNKLLIEGNNNLRDDLRKLQTEIKNLRLKSARKDDK